MGREISIGIYDIVRNTVNSDEQGDWHICGRNDFTDDLASLFYSRDADILIVDAYGECDDGKKAPNGCLDIGKNPLQIEEGREPVYIKKKLVDEVLGEHEEKRAKAIDALWQRILSLRNAMGNSRTLKDWLDFDGYLNEMTNEYEEMQWSQPSHLSEALDRALYMCSYSFGDDAIVEVGIGSFESPARRVHRYLPVIVLSE